jgi:ABC-type polysaccharide/polyol phosphate export permease
MADDQPSYSEARRVETGTMTSSSPDSLAAKLVALPREEEAVLEQAPETRAEVVDYTPSLAESLRDAWHSRHLIRVIASTALMAYIVKYRLGPTWLLLQTFMPIIGYSLIFGGGVFNVNAPNGMPYWLFLMVGMMGWQLFMSTLIIASRSFLRLKSLIRAIHVPLILVPIAGSSQALIRFFLQLAAYLIAIVYYWAAQGQLYAQLSPRFLLMSVSGLLLCATFAWGIALWTAPLTAHTRDVRMVLKYMLPFWMFVTPVIYPIEKLHGTPRLVAELNPLSSPVEMAKVGLLGAGSVRVYAAIWSVASITLVFLSGVWFMNRFGRTVLEMRPDDEEEEEMLM